MARILIPCPPLLGHLQPALVARGRALCRRGHEVDVLTAADHEPLVRDHDLGFRPLPANAIGRPAGRLKATGPAVPWVRARRDVIARFVDPLIGQADALSGVLAAGDYDVVVADTAYLGVLPLLLGPRGSTSRPPVVGLGATPISAVSVDAAPFGSGLRNADTRFARQRNRQVNWLLHHGPLRPIHDALDRVLAEVGVPAGTADYSQLLARHLDPASRSACPNSSTRQDRGYRPPWSRAGPLPIPACVLPWAPPGRWNRPRSRGGWCDPRDPGYGRQ